MDTAQEIAWTKVREIAEIQIGYQNRDSARPASALTKGSHRIIQIKDLDPERRFKSMILDRGGIAPYVWPKNIFWITPPGDAERYLVKRGDVLFLSRGQKPFAVAVSDDLPQTIASYYFYILRPDSNRILPEYLAWFINQPSAQAYLESRQLGSHIKMVPKLAFEELAVALPPLATQRAIVALEKLRQKEEHFMAQLAKARKRLIDGVALLAATGNSARQ